MRRMIVLGAMEMHRRWIQEAQRRGWEVHTADYLPDAPCHAIADSAHIISTTDIPAIEHLARSIQADVVTTFNSDPAAYTAAIVSHHLGLHGNPADTVRMMSDKALFRSWLKERGFAVPAFISGSGHLDNPDYLSAEKCGVLHFPIVIKPSDASGSKGVSRAHTLSECADAISMAMQYSRNGVIIAEEYVGCVGHQLHGDAFIKDGEVHFLALGYQHFGGVSKMVPVSTSFPSKLPTQTLMEVKRELQRFISLSGFRNGAINVEVRIGSDEKIYLMEVGARAGGNYTHEAIEASTGFDVVSATFDSYDHFPASAPPPTQTPACYIVLHTNKKNDTTDKDENVLKEIKFSKELTPYIKAIHMYKTPGDKITSLHTAADALGVVICQFDSHAQMDEILQSLEKHCVVIHN